MSKPLLAASLLLAAASHLLAPATVVAAPAGTATARYNPSTGTIVLDVGSGLGVLAIESPGNVIAGQTHSPPPQRFDENEIGYLNSAGVPPQVIRLENALVAGLSPNDIFFGYYVIGGDDVFPEVAIPEPKSPALLTIGLVCGLWATGRRPSNA